MADDGSGNISDPITSAANQYGVDPAYLSQVAAIESSNNPNAVSPTGAKGLFQFTPSTAKQYGLTDPSDPAQNANAAARLTRDNTAKLTQALGRPPTSGELYLAHQQGATGAVALLTHPNQNAVDALTPVYGGNVAKATQAISANGGSPTLPASTFANQWTSKFASPGTNAVPQAQPGTNAVPQAQPDANAASPDDSGGKLATGLTGNSAAENLSTAVSDGAKIKSAFTTGISAPSLMPLSSSPAVAPVMPATAQPPSNNVIPNSMWPS